MSKQDKGSKAGAGNIPRRKNPGLEVVNIYGSGPLPVGLREAPEPTAERPEGDTEATGQDRSGRGRRPRGGKQPTSRPETKK